jgi:hypothetical protein
MDRGEPARSRHTGVCVTAEERFRAPSGRENACTSPGRRVDISQPVMFTSRSSRFTLFARMQPRYVMTRSRLFALAALLIVIGVGLMVPEGPETECAKDASMTSGFVDEEKDCPISIESYNRIREAKTGPQWDNIGGLVLVVGGVAAGVVALVRKPRDD